MTKTLRLILGDQLDDRHSWFNRVDRNVIYTMMEVRQETDYVTHHIQKVTAFFKAMRLFCDQLRSQRHRVLYIQLDDPDNHQSIEQNILNLIATHGITRFEYQSPDEYRLREEFASWTARLPVEGECQYSEHFLFDPAEFEALFNSKKRFLMETFYRHMRKRYDILLTEGKPEGGKWNYDAQNRNRYDGVLPLPEPLLFDNDVSDIFDMIETVGLQTIGEIYPRRLIWPVNRAQAEALLDYFIEQCLAGFGTYQDAMSSESWSLFHGRLSFALNVKMLRPMKVIQRVLEAYRRSSGDITLPQAEGFVRQILGWREYIRCMYWLLMPEFETMNYFGHREPLPSYYWTGKTQMRCMRMVIRQSLNYAYAHHIQRLMVTGNFALLAGISPLEVEAWYLGIYIDAIQWVELPNTLGMSQFADGGMLATKPYVSSARYINRMSDYCSDCNYHHDESVGDAACPFNALYWDFLIRNQHLLRKNARMSMMYRVWDKMKLSKKTSILRQAETYLKRIDEL